MNIHRMIQSGYFSAFTKNDWVALCFVIIIQGKKIYFYILLANFVLCNTDTDAVKNMVAMRLDKKLSSRLTDMMQELTYP